MTETFMARTATLSEAGAYRYVRDFVEALVVDFKRGVVVDPCIDWPYARDDDGYPRWTHRGQKGTTLVHRWILIRITGRNPKQLDAAHSCGRGSSGCVNPSHLRWASRAENEADKNAHGTRSRGEAHHMARWSDALVDDVRVAYAAGERVVSISERTGVPLPTLYAWLNGATRSVVE